MRVTIERLDAEETGWDEFVRSSPHGTVFHLSAWMRVVAHVFGHTPHYLMARTGHEIQGVLPLFEVRGLLTGHVLMSTPYAAYGGLCGTQPAARDALLARAGQLAKERSARYVELRQRFDPVPELVTRQFFVTFIKLLDPDPEANFASLPRKRRAMIRQGWKNGLESRRGWEALTTFHDLYTRNRRRLGSPPFPLRLFRAIRDFFGEETGLLTIWHADRMVAGVLSFYYGDQVIPYYGASLPGASRLAVNDYMYWELMRESCLDGRRQFDFGQSHKGSGTYEYKRHWGFKPTPVPYQYLSGEGRRFPTGGGSSPYLRHLTHAWRLLPLSITRRAGPFLIRRLPLH